MNEEKDTTDGVHRADGAAEPAVGGDTTSPTDSSAPREGSENRVNGLDPVTGDHAVPAGPVNGGAIDASADPSSETASAASAAGDGAAGDSTTGGAEASGVAPLYGVGPFSLRELVLVGIWAVAFLVSFFGRPGQLDTPQLAALGASVWNSGIDWVLTIGVPTVAVGLLVLRRLSPTAIRRVGSLGVDQFASVAFSVSAIAWLAMLWNGIAVFAASGALLISWAVFPSFFLMLGGVVFTVFAPLLPMFGDDFAHREEQPAHRVARPTRRVTRRPAPPAPAPVPASEPVSASAPVSAPAPAGHVGTSDAASRASAYPSPFAPAEPAEPAVSAEPTGHSEPAVDVREEAGSSDADDADAAVDGGEGDRAAQEPSSDAVSSAEQERSTASVSDETVVVTPVPSNQPFWALVPVERDIIDETGTPIFRIGPTAWALVLEDRVDYFVVRHDDGRVGYLMDVSGITRG